MPCHDSSHLVLCSIQIANEIVNGNSLRLVVVLTVPAGAASSFCAQYIAFIQNTNSPLYAPARLITAQTNPAYFVNGWPLSSTGSNANTAPSTSSWSWGSGWSNLKTLVVVVAVVIGVSLKIAGWCYLRRVRAAAAAAAAAKAAASDLPGAELAIVR